MQTIAHALRQFAALLAAPCDWFGPVLGLTLWSVASGVLMLLVLKVTTDQAGMTVARDRMSSTVYEMRLFMDSPRLLLGAQWRFLIWNARYLGKMLPAFLIFLPPLALVYPQMEIRYGLAPLPVSEHLLLRVALADGVDPGEAAVKGTQGAVTVTAPPFWDEARRELLLRLRVERPGEHEVTVRVAGTELEKTISADPQAPLVSAERVQGLADAVAFGDEPPLPAGGPVLSVSLKHEQRMEGWAGTGLPWWLGWLVIATAAALVLRKPLGVVI